MKQALLTFLGLAAMWPATQVSAQITAADISWKDYGMAYEEETDAVLISEWRAFHYLASYFDGKNFSNYDTVQTELSVAISSLALSNDIDLSGRDLSFDLNIPFDGRGHKISNPGGQSLAPLALMVKSIIWRLFRMLRVSTLQVMQHPTTMPTLAA